MTSAPLRARWPIRVDGWLRDLRFGARTLARQPAFSLAAIATLALGIGAATAIFSVAYGVSLRPLPYPDPGRLVRIYEANAANAQPREDVSEATFHDWREGTPSLEHAALYTKPRSRFLDGTEPIRVTTMGVSPAFFDVLGVRPAFGRSFRPEREYTRTTREVVLSFGAWRRLFGGDTAIVGRPVRFADDEDAWVVIGVMPESFAFTQSVDIYQPRIIRLPVGRVVRGWRYDRVIARLRPGIAIEQARAELGAVSTRLAREFPTISAGWSVTVDPLHDSVVGSFARATWLLLAAVAVVLMVACLNVGGLLVARAVARDRETAVRAALGAGSWRLLRLWLAEAALLGTAGAGLGLAIAWAGVATLKAAAPPGIPRLDAIALDLPAVAVAVAATAVAILMFTVAPLGTRRQILHGLGAGSAGAGDSPKRHAARTALMMTQCAGAAALVVVAVLLTRSFIKLTALDPGWDATGVLSMTVNPPMPRELGRPWYRYVEWSDRLVQRLEATPGIARAAITTQVPLSPDPYASTIARGRGKAAGDIARWPGVAHHVTDGYFDTMGIRVVSGRRFGDSDRFTEGQLNYTDKADRGVAMVTESTARALWPGQPAIGQSMWLPDIDNTPWREVVGVVEDIQFHAVGEAPALHVFVPWTQASTGRPRLVARASVDAAAITPTVRAVVESVEPGTRIDAVTTLDALVSRATAQPRFTTRLVAAFGGLALLLAAVGIYGTLSYVVGSRTREIGIRLALGASRGAIMSNIVRRGVVPALAGGLLGLAIAVAVARVFRALLFGVDPVDPASIAGGAAVLIAVALAASAGPAYRAARVDPVRALRTD
jgi:putative ABC transport system permease protein